MEYKEKIEDGARLLKAISHPLRLCLVKHLCENDQLNVAFFTTCLPTSQSNISQHLGKLRDVGIVGYDKRGQEVHYFIKNQDVRKVVNALFEEEKNV